MLEVKYDRFSDDRTYRNSVNEAARLRTRAVRLLVLGCVLLVPGLLGFLVANVILKMVIWLFVAVGLVCLGVSYWMFSKRKKFLADAERISDAALLRVKNTLLEYGLTVQDVSGVLVEMKASRTVGKVVSVPGGRSLRVFCDTDAAEVSVCELLH